MKKNIKILFTFIFVLFFTNKVIACELFNIEPGSDLSSLYKIIGDDEKLQDWQESHIAQLADDIGEPDCD